MGPVQLQHVEAGLVSPARTLSPGFHEVLDLVSLQSPRHRPFLAMSDRTRRDRRPRFPVMDIRRAQERAVSLPGAIGARLAAGMTELNAGRRVLLLDECDQPLQRFDEKVVPDAEVAHGA